MAKKKYKKCDLDKDGICVRAIKDTCPKDKCLGLDAEALNNKLRSINYKYEK